NNAAIEEKLSRYTINGKLTKKCAILVLCSNSSLLDFTSRRILSKIQKHKMADPEKRFINFVRMGSEISDDLKPYGLEALVERNLKFTVYFVIL
uniref:Uncharacterized protein n=1 Tax=Romanomermis culicivorax TaxID=13658 RepID=A0A915JMZ0_ROMCU